MGQHKHNPTAIAAARGELKPLDRSKTLGSFDLVSRFGGPITDTRYVWHGDTMRRRFQKVAR